MLRERLGTREHDAAKRAVVAAQRPRRNTEGGYWIAAEASTPPITPSPEAPLVDVRQAAVLTDGAAALVDYGAADWPEVLAVLGAYGPGFLIDRVGKTEANDPRGERWPRYKHSDDATVAHCAF
jgi:hypothetical protein